MQFVVMLIQKKKLQLASDSFTTEKQIIIAKKGFLAYNSCIIKTT